jgi:autotransporter-associated beta strand protein
MKRPACGKSVGETVVSPGSRKATGMMLLGAAVIFASAAAASAQGRVLGIDVSAWQANISAGNWTTLKRATDEQVGGIFGDGRDFVFIRSSRGGTTGYYNQNDADNSDGLNTLSQRYDDPYFVQNITRATSAGLLAGPYHFARPDVIATTQNSGGVANSGTDEANHMIEMAGAWMRPGYMLPVLDLEAGQSQRTSAQLTSFCVEFSDRIYGVTGIRPIIYINGNYANYVQAPIVSACPVLWSARWPNQTDPNSIPVQIGHPKDSYTPIYGPWDDAPRPIHPWAFWQYASTARLNGYASGGANIDVNVAQGGMEFIKDFFVPALWLSNTDGQWTTLSNWNSGLTPVAPVQGPGQVPRVGTLTLPTPRLPGSNDTVTLERPSANVTVTLGSGTHNIRKLDVREALNITNGSLTINYVPSADSTPVAAQFSGPVTLTGNGSLSVHTLQVDPTRTFTLGGGTLTFNTIKLMPHATSPGRIVMMNATMDVVIDPLAGAMATVTSGAGSGNSGLIDLGGGTRFFGVVNGPADVDFSVDVPISNGALTKTGAGTMRLSAANSYAGGTFVFAGRLLVNNATGSGTGSGYVNVGVGATLGGTGTIAGRVSLGPFATLAPGNSIGTLTISNSLHLISGVTVMELNATARTNDVIRGLTTVEYGGTLILSNRAGTLTASNAFKLFDANSYEGAFAALNPAIPGPGLAWNTKTLATDGTLRVVSTSPVTMSNNRSGNLLGFSWPTDHIGWRLQAQTNSTSVGLGTDWRDVPNSIVTNLMTFTLDPSASCVFYRLVYP